MVRIRRAIACLVTLGVLAALTALPGELGAPAASAQSGVELPEHIIEALADGEPVQLIVSGSVPTETDATGRTAVRMSLQPDVDDPLVERSLPSIGAVVTTVDSVEQARALAGEPGVTGVTLGSEQATRFVDESRAITGVDGTHANGLLGNGITVAVVDGGIEGTHPDLSSSLTYEACFIHDLLADIGHCVGGATEATGPGVAPDDSLSHGTYVAGIIVGDGGLAPLGIAPQASLEVYKIFEEASGGYLSDVVRVLDHIATERPDVDIINMSFGFEARYTASCDADYTALFDAIEVLRDRGVVVIAASGNRGFATMGAPACLSNVISVGASVDIEDDPAFGQVAELSNISSVTDLVAPGTQVETTRTGSTVAFVQGTSFASAHVAACAALMREGGLRTAPATEARLLTSATIAPNPGGRSLPVVDCLVGPAPTGNVNCDSGRSVVDGMVIAQFVVGTRTDRGSCPLMDPGAEINASQADINGDGTINVVDALVVTLCVVGADSPYC